VNKKIVQVCSNCGKTNVYSIREYKGRENTLCKYCGHTLSICTWFVELMKYYAKEVRNEIERVKK